MKNLAFTLICLFFVIPVQAGTIYVDANSPPGGNGLTWVTAYKYLQNGLADATSGDDIWVAEGTYNPDVNSSYPDGTGDRLATFQLINGVGLYGGFPSGGGLWTSRNPDIYQTILSGDLDENDADVNDPCDFFTEPTRAENSYHVVIGSDTDATAIIDGFIIVAGHANAPPEIPFPGRHGGGMFNFDADCIVNNCTFIENIANYGGAIAGSWGCDNLHVTNCTFRRNAAGGNGGGIDLYQSNNPVVANCTFIGNVGILYGAGGMSVVESNSPTLTNCIFSRNSALNGSGGGIFNTNDSCPTIINCVFNGNSALNGDGGGVSNNNGSCPIVTNCTFVYNSATNASGGVHDSDNSNPIITNCILWGNTASTDPQVGNVLNSAATINYSVVQGGWSGPGGIGIIDTDPLFTDPNNGDFHLKSKGGRWNPNMNAGAGGWVKDRLHSPCIDTGNPSDSVEDEPAPNGNTINMGAYGGTEFASKSFASSGGDLVITELVVQQEAMAGRPMHVTWTVNNADSLSTIYAWFLDGLYFSTDEQWDINDIPLTTVWQYNPVGPGQSYQVDINAIMPGVLPGDYYIILRVDIGNHVDEPSGEENNIAVSESISLEVEELVIGTAVESEFTDIERARYYRIDPVEDKDLGTSLDDLDDDGSNELYISFEQVPTRNQFDYHYGTDFAADQTIRIPGTQAGSYYIMVYADSVPGGIPSDFNLNAQYLPLEIFSVTPDYCGNAENSTITMTIEGASFSVDDSVLLRKAGQEDIVSDEVTLVNIGTVYAHFDLQGAAAGAWELMVINSDMETASYPFTVIEGGEPYLVTNIILPDLLGFHRRAVLWIEYANIGDAPMPAPLLKLHGNQDALLTADPALDGPGLWTDNPPVGLRDTVQVMALGSGADPSVLNPGDSGRIPIYYRGLKQPWDWSYPPIEFTLGVLKADDTTPIDWLLLKGEMQPESIPADAWDAIWANFTEQVGDTWGDYVVMLNDNVSYLHMIGQDCNDVQSLWNFEIMQASGVLNSCRLANAIDTHSLTPGLPLVFSRSWGQSIAERYKLGPLGRGWTHNWNIHNEGICTDCIDQAGLVWQFRPDGLLDYIEDRNGNRITAEYTNEQLKSLTHSNGCQILFEYNVEGRISRVIDSRGVGPNDDLITTFEYDDSGEYLISVKAPGDLVTTYTYETEGTLQQKHALLSVKCPDNAHQYFTYDDNGRLFQKYRDGGAEAITYSYDTRGMVTVDDATGRQTVLFYGLDGQLTRQRDGEGNVISLKYNNDHQLMQLTSGGGEQYYYDYDSQGNLVGIENPLGRTTAFAYESSFNNMVSFTDARGNSVNYGYDSFGNLTSINYEDGTSESFTYDACGNIITWTNRRGDVITYTYNNAGQVTTKDYICTLGLIDCEYEYDANGCMILATDAHGTTAMSHDPNTGRLTGIFYPSGQSFAFTYDNAGRRTQRVDQDGNVVKYVYNVIGRLDQITDGNDILIADYDYDAAGRLVQKILRNGVYTTYGYDDAGCLTHIVNHAPNDVVISRFVYTYDASSRRTSMTANEGIYIYDYDPTGQLTKVEYPNGSVVEYIYDAVGNRVEVVNNGTSMAYTANKMNQYTDVNGVIYAYDADGNMKTKTEGGITTTYSYDVENRLIQISTPNDTWTYSYDAFGNRIASMHNDVTTHYIIDPIANSDVAAEYDGNGTLIARYTHGLSLLARTDTNAVSTYYTFDAIGSVSEMTDQTGNVLNRYTFDPFGVYLSKFETLANPFQYVGESGVMDSGLGLHNMRMRYYFPSLGRFLSMDPSNIPGRNGYTYAENNPVLYIDPLGLDVWSGEGGEVGGIIFVGKTTWKGVVCNEQTRECCEIMNECWQFGGGLGGSAAGSLTRFKGPSEGKDLEGTTWSAFASAGVSAGPVSVGGSGSYSTQDSSWGYGVSGGLGASFKLAAGAQRCVTTVLRCWSPPDPPNPPTPPGGGGSSGSGGSFDPNKKIGPRGFGGRRFIRLGNLLAYTVYFENDPNAAAAALKVHIEDQLDEDLDWTTFGLLEIGFGDRQITVPYGMSHYETSMNIDGWTWNDVNGWHTGETPMRVEIDAGIDITTGIATWNIRSFDPNTGWEPEDAYSGFLPPDDANDVTHRGEGFVSFLILPKSDLPTGTEITNRGDIYFDYNPVVETETVLNTVDDGTPHSNVLPLPGTIEEHSFTVEWTGQDDGGSGCGIAHYDIYVSTNGGPFTLWLSTSEASAVFNGQNRTTYEFYSVATDNVGNVEAAPDEPDAIITVFSNYPPIADAGPDQIEAAGEDCTAEITLDGSGSSDPDGDDLSYTWYLDGDEIATGVSPSILMPIGVYNIELIVNDGYEDSFSDYVTIAVEDVTPPELIVTVDPNVLWPPNHKMVLITPSWTVRDNCDESPEVTLISIVMNEGDETNTYEPMFDDSVGDGHTIDDIQVDSDGSIYLRAERSGTGNGRVYTLTYKAVDDSENVSVQSANVTVPHNQN